jgi:hypothetical protein
VLHLLLHRARWRRWNRHAHRLRSDILRRGRGQLLAMARTIWSMHTGIAVRTIRLQSIRIGKGMSTLSGTRATCWLCRVGGIGYVQGRSSHVVRIDLLVG